MPRSQRLFAPKLLYHIFTRGNNREKIFFEESDYSKFLSYINLYYSTLEYKLYSFCLLPNHFHLLLQSGNITISKIMQKLLTAYTMFINKKYNRVGHIFQGRFKSIIVDKESYLLQVVRYIHLNPVRAKIVNHPQDYRWSSYNYYLKKVMPVEWLDMSDVLSLFSHDYSKQINLFHQFTLADLKEDFDPMKREVRGILGDRKFTQKLTKVFKGIRP